MKQLLLSAILLVLSIQLHAEDFVRFSIDKKVYENLSTTQQIILAQKAGELTRFIEVNVKNKIPANILAKLSELRVKIQLTDEPGRDGLFIPQETKEHEILIQLNQINSNGIKALLAHEIFHAIHFHLNPDEMPWMREGMAQLFEYITTGELNGMNLSAAISNTMTPLLGEYNINQTSRAQYGHNLLYFLYLYSQCGQNNLFWNLVSGAGEKNLHGSFLIDEILAQANIQKLQCKNFEGSAISFEVAKLHNQIQFLSKENKEQYFIYHLDIKPAPLKFSSKEALQEYIDSMPALSSMKFPLVEFKKLQGQCKNCEILYAQKSFPYTVADQVSEKEDGWNVILVKLQNN